MKPAAFAYAKARSLDHAVELLRQDGTRVLAGGQSLIATLNMRLDAPDLLVDINGIAGLDAITEETDHLEIGALVRHAQALQSPVIARRAPLLALALPHIAHPAIRNRGTLCGSIAYADPAAELPACLIALDGEVVIAGPAARRQESAATFFRGLFETALKPGEIIAALRIRCAAGDKRYGFAELARRHGDYALVGLAGAATVSGQALRGLHLVYFGVGATPVRARAAEQAIESGGGLDAAVSAIASDLDPSDDIHASGRLKRHLAGVLLRRVVGQMLKETR